MLKLKQQPTGQYDNSVFTVHLSVMWFGICRSRYGIRIGLVRAKLDMLIRKPFSFHVAAKFEELFITCVILFTAGA